MRGSGASAAVRYLQTLLEAGAGTGPSDGHLLDRFVARRDGTALEALVRRHGPMVWGVCCRVLRDHHDAEDAFQATFLVLARKAAAIVPREKVGNWLYGVAYQTARKARATRAKRRAREAGVPDAPEPAAPPPPRHDLAELLDRELARLPDKYRTPVVLCELEGKTHGEAAAQLGWPVGTVSGRLSRAKAMLVERLTRRGVAPVGGLLAVVLTQNQGAASAAVPPPLLASTARAAGLFADGSAAAGFVSPGAVALTREVLKAMWFSKIKTAAAACLAVAVVGTGLWQAASRADEAARPNGIAPAAVNEAGGKAPSDGTYRVAVNEVIRDDTTLVAQIDVETPPGAKVELTSDKPGDAGTSTSSGPAGPGGLFRVRLVVLADLVELKGAGAVKFVLAHQFGKISSSTTDTVPLPAGAKVLADVVTVPVKSGEYKYGQPTKLLTFKGVTYTLAVHKPD